MQLRKIKKVEQKSDAKHGVCGGTQRVPPDESCSKGTRVHFFFRVSLVISEQEPTEFQGKLFCSGLSRHSSVPGLRGDVSGSCAPLTSVTFPQESELKARMNGHDA